MQFKSILTCASILAAGFAAQSASGQAVGDYRSNVSPSGIWDNKNNWQVLVSTGPDVWNTASAVPGNGDDVYIWAGDTITLDSISTLQLQSLHVQSTAALVLDCSSAGISAIEVTAADGAPIDGAITLASDGDLDLQGNSSLALTGTITVNSGGYFEISGTGTHDVDGTISVAGTFVFSSAGTLDIDTANGLTVTGTATFTGAATMDISNGANALLSGASAVMNVNENVTFTNTGKFTANNASAQLNVANTKTLTLASSPFTVEGRFVFGGPGTVDNDGIVVANAAGTLSLDTDLILSGNSSGEWKAMSSASAIMQFNRAHTGANRMGGSLLVNNCATFNFNNVAIETSGGFTGTQGFLTKNGSGTFNHTCPSPCTSVSLPASYGTCP